MLIPDSRFTRVVVRPLVLALATAVVVVAGVGAARATKLGVGYVAHGQWSPYVEFEVVRAAFQRIVPTGAKVFVAAADVHWNSYLREISVLCGARLVEAGELADVIVDIEPAPGEAGGVRLIVRPA